MTDIHSTQNLYEAAYILAKGFKLSGKERTPHKTVLLFEGEDVAQESINFYNGGLIQAKAFSDAYRTLKDYIFER